MNRGSAKWTQYARDGVIVNPPVYPPFFADVTDAGRRVVEVPLRRDGGLDVAGIADAFAAGARALLLCNPHNPTGRVWTRAELEAVAAAADAHDAWVLSDEIHAPLAFDGIEFTPYLSVSTRGAALTSASKAFNLAGLKLGIIVSEHVDRLPPGMNWRAGYLGAVAAEAAFAHGDEWLDETRATIAANHASWPPSFPPGSPTRCRRRAISRGWTVAPAGSATIPPLRSRSAGVSRSRAGWTSVRRVPALPA